MINTRDEFQNYFFIIANEIQKVILSSIGDVDKKDKIVNHTLLSLSNSIVEQAKSIVILLNANNVEAVGLILRSQFELYLSVEFIVQKKEKGNIQKRAKAHYYFSRLQSLNNLKDFEEANPDDPKTYTAEDCSRELENATNIQDLIDHYDVEYKKLFRYPPKKYYYKNWFTIDEQHSFSIQRLVRILKLEPSLYTLFYKYGSMDMHGSSIYDLQKKRFSKNMVASMTRTLVQINLDRLVKFYKIESSETTDLLSNLDYINKKLKEE
ncbi:hypothetical protein CI088_01345 [Enterococcus plantarum]|uniref:Uncharacterized protein n=1 Tax=Enterococcus plantarum TaxID=1077675 RepID=A0A2W3ZTF7_9ENTE|nr:DUF5677 domain-containing protein [Enterococcus plantarum]PZL77474.1 hypothetical protein CI088_01345 [Enterococcus plantarum]